MSVNTLKSDWLWCYEMLEKTSRSFAAVIQGLGEELRDAIALFYLTLRALDTIEDDPKFEKAKKVPLLISFHSKLNLKGWSYSECGTEDEKILLSNFARVIHCFSTIRSRYQQIIENITLRMGKGMSEFIEREVITLQDWDLYCHYVAGLVGIGLSKLFAASTLEDSSFDHMDNLSNSMGLFLQKTNIIRDYLEDINDNRIFWPRAVWEKYAHKLEDFKYNQYETQAVYCLNELITNALHHIPDCLEYMAKLKDPNIFNFCAIPQIMAIATLSLCYANHDVFTSVVKMKRSLTEEIILNMNGMKSIYHWYYKFIGDILAKMSHQDPNYSILLKSLVESKKLIELRVSNIQASSKL